MPLHLQAAGISWTIGSKYFDGINYGLFYNDWALERIIQKLVEEAHRLKAKKILIGECGHAARSARQFVPAFANGRSLPVVSILEITSQAVREGKLRLKKDEVTERVTYHDPCNIARSGWIVDQPRQLLRSFVNDFVEMQPNGRENYCCGGGGGLVSLDETYDFRMQVAGKTKAEQIQKTGAQIVATPCANCKKQLRELVDYYKLPVQIVGVHDLVLRAIDLWINFNTGDPFQHANLDDPRKRPRLSFRFDRAGARIAAPDLPDDMGHHRSHPPCR